jgi:hypothetical protein
MILLNIIVASMLLKNSYIDGNQCSGPVLDPLEGKYEPEC